MKRDFSAEFDKNDLNYFELINVAAQTSRMINDQVKTEGIELDHKITTEALGKVLDGRVVTIREDESV